VYTGRIVVPHEQKVDLRSPATTGKSRAL
jgi:hypothetical protein